MPASIAGLAAAVLRLDGKPAQAKPEPLPGLDEIAKAAPLLIPRIEYLTSGVTALKASAARLGRRDREGR